MSGANNDRSRRLALGTVQFGLAYGVANTTGQVPLGEAARIIDLAREGGIDTIDTAIGYGESEQVLGQIGVDDLRVVSKLPPLPHDIEDVQNWVRSELAGSLERLQVAGLYALLLHRPADLLGPHGAVLAGTMRELKEQGLVARTGVSVYAPRDLDIYGRMIDLDLVQAPLNLVDTRFATSGWMQRLKASGTEIHVRSAFLQGLLLMPRAAVPEKFARWAHLFDRWHEWLGESAASAVPTCLDFPLSFPAVDRVVVGAIDVTQLSEILNGAGRVTDMTLPDISSNDEDLVDPSRWVAL